MSRGHEARRKARRREARAAPPTRRRRRRPQLRPALIPIALIAIIPVGFAAIEVLGSDSGRSVSYKQVTREVKDLLAGIPQAGATLGSPDAPITLQVFGDLECPTVARFVALELPAIVDNWVRPGIVQLEYRSLETDTANEDIFIQQEIAALAAGRQDRLWNFLATFLGEQVPDHLNYATEDFLIGIATQVPGLKMKRWRQDRNDNGLFRQVIQGVRRARLKDMTATPAFLIGHSQGQIDRRIGPRTESGPLLDAELLQGEIEALRDEDISTLGAIGP